MNKINFALCTLALSLVLGGCASNTAQNIGEDNTFKNSSSADITSITSKPLEVKSESEPTEQVMAQIETEIQTEENSKMENNLYVADAAMYRGNIKEIKENGTWVLEQVIGKDYGAETIEINISENTNFGTNKQNFNIGDYVEVFYGRAMGEDMPETADAIAVNKLIPSKSSVYTGVFKGLIDEDGRKSILMGAFDNINNQFIFHISDETNIYLNFEDLKDGDKLFIYHKGIATRSIPPQGVALEISKYNEETQPINP